MLLPSSFSVLGMAPQNHNLTSMAWCAYRYRHRCRYGNWMQRISGILFPRTWILCSIHWNFGWLWVNGFPNLVSPWVLYATWIFISKVIFFLAQDIFRDVCDSCALENHVGSAFIVPTKIVHVFSLTTEPRLWDGPQTYPGKQSLLPQLPLPTSSHFLAALGLKSLSGSQTQQASLGRAVLHLEARAKRQTVAKACSFLECRLKDKRNYINRHMSQQ